MSVNVSEKKIKSKVKSGDRVVVVENIRYPCFESEKYNKLCGKMNEFYSSVAKKYSFHIRNRLPGRMRKLKSASSEPCMAGMDYTVAFYNDSIVSVVLDLSFRCGKTLKMRRFSQMWNIREGCIMKVSDIIKTDGKSKKKIYAHVLKRAVENNAAGTFGYFDGYDGILSKSFDVRNCFAVPNGLCFFVNGGILAPAKYGAGNFVIPFDKLSDVLNSPFLPQSDEKQP